MELFVLLFNFLIQSLDHLLILSFFELPLGVLLKIALHFLFNSLNEVRVVLLECVSLLDAPLNFEGSLPCAFLLPLELILLRPRLLDCLRQISCQLLNLVFQVLHDFAALLVFMA